ncbi:hypothetical protein LRC484719_15140 [Mycobacterium riyadhense]
MRVVDDEQQVAITAQRCPGRPQQRSGFTNIGDIHQMAEGPEWDHAFGWCPDHPAGERGWVLADVPFGGQSGQRGFAASVGSKYRRAGVCGVTQRDIQLR